MYIRQSNTSDEISQQGQMTLISQTFQMNSNHYDPKVIYSLKIKRISHNLTYLQEAAEIIQALPLKTLQEHWRTIAAEELPQKNSKHKPINKALFKQCIKKTVQAFINDQKEMKKQIQEKMEQIDEESITAEQNMLSQLQDLTNRPSHPGA